MKRILLSLFITSSVLAAHADEGMWMLTDLQKQNEVAMTELGLLIPANQIYNPDGIALKEYIEQEGTIRWQSHLCRRPGTDQPPLRL